MTMEEKIRKAMMELGLDPDGSETNDKPTKVEVKTKTEPAKESKPASAEVPKKKAKVIEEESIEDEPAVAVEAPEEPVEAPNVQEPQSIFMKISGNHMVLLIPDGLELNKQVIGRTTYRTITVQVPDFGGKLYEMPLLNATPAPKPSVIARVPIFTPKPKPEADNEYLKELRKEKHKLDAEIKVARANKDDDLVKELRKHRRHIRSQINRIMEG